MIESERLLLASVVIDPTKLAESTAAVTGVQFLDRDLGRVYDHLGDLHAAGVAITDLKVLTTELKKAELLDAVGGLPGIASLVNSVPTSSNAMYHAREVERQYQLRRLSSLGSKITNLVAEPDAVPSEIAETIQAQLLSVPSKDRVDSLPSIMLELASSIENDLKREKVAGVETGIYSLDRFTGGLMPGELIVLGARTSIGKTALGTQIALDVAKVGHSTLLVSLEMAHHQLAQRIAASELDLSLTDQRTGYCTTADVERIREYAESAQDTPLYLLAARRANMARIRGIARSHKSVHGLDLLLVDYLQLISPSNPRQSKYEAITEISADLKTLAMELECPVIALAQLNRCGEGEAPKISHLRDSGAIEQDADGVWLLHRARDSADTTLIVAKQRQGPLGELSLRFDGARCRFEESSPVDVFDEYANA